MMLRLFLPIFILSIGLLSCDASHYITKMEKFREKAENKGAIFTPDTVWKYKTKIDTILDPVTNEIRIVETVYDSVPYPVERIKYVPISRQERKALKDSMRFALKKQSDSLDYLMTIIELSNERLEDSLKQMKGILRITGKTEISVSRHENKKPWLFWLGVLVGFICTLLIVYLFRGLICRLFRFVP